MSEKIAATIQKNVSQIVEIVNKDLLPKLREITQGLLNIVAGIVEKITDVFFTYLAKLSEIIDAHQAELKQIATTLSSISQGEFYMKSSEQHNNKTINVGTK